MYSHILVPLDGSVLAKQALPYVRILSKGFQASVELIRVIDPGRDGQADLGIESEARTYLQTVAASLAVEGINVSSVVHPGDVAPCIIKEAGKRRSTLIAMSTHGRSAATRWLLGSVTDKVLQATTNPLLIVRPDRQEVHPSDVSPRTVVLPLDGSTLAEEVLPRVVALAKALHLRVTVIRVVPSSTNYQLDIGRHPTIHEASPQQQYEEAAVYLRRVRQKLSDEGVPEVLEHVMYDHPAIAIVDFAREVQPSLVAMTTHGRTGIGRWVLGSVTDRVVRHSESPVLVVRSVGVDAEPRPNPRAT